jgi:uncharacterized protein (DUF486 family)
MEKKSKAYDELKRIVEAYSKIFPKETYPWVMLSAASCAVFFGWFGGKYLFGNYELLPRMVSQWSISLIEYTFLLPGIGGATEVLGYSQNSMAVIIHAIQLTAYFILNIFTTKIPFTWRHAVSFILMIVAILLVV